VKGTPDHKIPITEAGKQQAIKTGIYLKKKYGKPDYVYHSGYLRTIQTADGILQSFTEKERKTIRVRMNQFIRERDSGYTYDMTKEQAVKAFPWLQDHWDTFGGYFSRPPGGESLADVSQRVYSFLNTLFRDRKGKKVWIVLHGGTLRALRFLLERWDFDRALKWPEGQTPENCGITVYDYDKKEERLVLKEYNKVVWR
jgi:broad specificity phosphatase PhoE